MVSPKAREKPSIAAATTPGSELRITTALVIRPNDRASHLDLRHISNCNDSDRRILKLKIDILHIAANRTVQTAQPHTELE